ncbi:hypothetical protein EDB19DRAFT_1830149 [Suillus lakei]|nr:hypothetical protein EDB19DRAFT_1830149 [Suillus lakei]
MHPRSLWFLLDGEAFCTVVWYCKEGRNPFEVEQVLAAVGFPSAHPMTPCAHPQNAPLLITHVPAHTSVGSSVGLPLQKETDKGALQDARDTAQYISPALNVLWRDLHSMEPLIRCLPADLFGFNRRCTAKFTWTGIAETS